MSYGKDKFWKAFGEQRFTKASLWSEFGHGQFPGFPPAEWLEHIGIGCVSWIVPAMGPRGGEGWRLSDEVIAQMRANDKKAKVRDEKCKALLAAVKPRIGECRVVDGKVTWIFWPPSTVDRGPWQRKWSATTKATVIQEELDRVALEFVRVAARAQEYYRAQLAEIDRIVAAASAC